MSPNRQKAKNIWLSVDGKIIKDHKIEGYTFGLLLSNIQRTFNILQEVKYKKQRKATLKWYFSSISEGSCILELQPGDMQTDFSNFDDFVSNLNDFTGDFFEYIQLLSVEPTKFKEKLEREFKEKTDIIRFLSGLLGIWSKRGKYSIEIAFSYEKPLDFTSYTSLPSHRYHYIQDLIQEYIEQTIVEVIGVIERIKGDEPRSFFIEDTNGDMVEITYPPELEKTVISLFKSTVVVHGVLVKKARKNYMEFLKNIKPLRVFQLSSIRDIQFKQDIQFKFFYDRKNESWNFINEELELYGSGTSFENALEDLGDSIDSLIVGFLAFKNEDISSHSKEVKIKLEQYIDFEKCTSLYNPIIMDEKDEH